MLAVYTCFFGTHTNWANRIPTPLEGIDHYYFTNNPTTYEQLASTSWTRVWVDLPMSDDNLVCAEQTKHLRCCPEEYPQLRRYSHVCWIDSKLTFTSRTAVFDLLDALDRSAAVWVFTRHPLPYTDVWGEYHEAIKHEKYARQQDRYSHYIQSRLAMGYSEQIPQRVCCGFSLRKMCPLAFEIGKMWYREIQECGIEDQISFQFVHQRYEDAILMVPYQTGWSYIE